MYDYIESNPKLRLALKRKQNWLAWGVVICFFILSASIIWGYRTRLLNELEIAPISLCGLDVVFCSYDAVMPNLRLTDTIYEVTTTAYTSRPQETDDSPCIAADGSNICQRYASGEGICAANWLPLGSKLFVEGYGDCTVADRMAKKNSEKLDVYFGYDIYSAQKWGVKFIKVYAKP